MFQRDARTPSWCLRFPVFALLVVLVTPLAARAAEFHVNRMLDLPDDIPGDGVCMTPPSNMAGCTLRAAIMEANALGGPHVIHLPAGLYQLTRSIGRGERSGFEEDVRQITEGALGHDAWDDLDIGTDLEIIGAGEDATLIEGAATDRVFHVLHGARTPRLVRFADLTISNGRTVRRGAGVLLDQVQEAHFDGVTIADNRGALVFLDGGESYYSEGGAIFSAAAEVHVTRSTLRNNVATIGGGLAVRSGWAFIVDTTIEGNEARSQGGFGAGPDDGRLGMGGGIALLATLARATFMEMRGSTLTGNRADYGGGLGAWGGFSIVNSTFSDNTAQAWGGGAFVRTPIAALISLFEFTTVAGNSAASGGGVYRETFEPAGHRGRVLFSRTIVANNAADNCAGAGRPMSIGHNLEDAATCGFTSGTDLSNTEPNLGPLLDNGGPTATHALLTGSPAINRAGMSGWRVDQRGITRPQGSTMDIGAYEYTQPRLRIPFPIPRRFEGLFGFSLRVDLQGTSGATLKEIVPAIDGLKLSIELDKSGKSAIVSAAGLNIDVNALRTKTKQKQPALFYIGADDQQGSEFFVISDQRFDAGFAGVTKLPVGKK